jgi:hypothetical protein
VDARACARWGCDSGRHRGCTPERALDGGATVDATGGCTPERCLNGGATGGCTPERCLNGGATEDARWSDAWMEVRHWTRQRMHAGGMPGWGCDRGCTLERCLNGGATVDARWSDAWMGVRHWTRQRMHAGGMPGWGCDRGRHGGCTLERGLNKGCDRGRTLEEGPAPLPYPGGPRIKCAPNAVKSPPRSVPGRRGHLT